MTVEDEDDDAEDVAPVPTGDLPREAPPPAELEERVVAALAARGLIEPSRLRGASRVKALALMAASLAVGIGVGVLLARLEPGQDRFVLFLHAAPAGEPAGDEASRVREYGEWARELRRRGVPIRGEKLADEVHILGLPTASDADPVSGYFILGVTEAREAVAVAESCPHLRHGGRIEVRRIESR